MKTRPLYSALCASILLIGTAAANAQTVSQPSEPENAADTGMSQMMKNGAPEIMPLMMGQHNNMDSDMMQQSQMPMAGNMMSHMMRMMMGAHSGSRMQRMIGDLGAIYGMPSGEKEMTPERVRAFLEKRLVWQNNPRLKIGEIATAKDGSITAEILTVDDSLVQKLAFNRFPGLARTISK